MKAISWSSPVGEMAEMPPPIPLPPPAALRIALQINTGDIRRNNPFLVAEAPIRDHGGRTCRPGAEHRGFQNVPSATSEENFFWLESDIFDTDADSATPTTFSPS